MKKNLRIVSGIFLLISTLGFALLPITIEKKIKELNNEVDVLDSRIIGLEKRISKTHNYLWDTTILSQHIELLQVLGTEDMLKEKKKELMMHKYTALLSAYNILEENRIIDSIRRPPLDIKSSADYQKRFDLYLENGILSAKECSGKMKYKSVKLNSLEYKKKIAWVILISLQGLGLFLGIISRNK